MVFGGGEGIWVKDGFKKIFYSGSLLKHRRRDRRQGCQPNWQVRTRYLLWGKAPAPGGSALQQEERGIIPVSFDGNLDGLGLLSS
jgi:hypothetical protein